jgi:hypothetical protein
MIWRSAIILLLCAATAWLCHSSPAARGGDEAGVIAELPLVAGGYVGETEEQSESEKKLLPADSTQFKRVYRTPGRRVEERDVAHASLVIAGQDTRAIHRPEVCLPGQGWTITASRVLPIELPTGQQLYVRDLSLERIDQRDEKRRLLRAHYIYWFVGKDVTTTSDAKRQWLSFSDSVFRQVNHRWAYPSVMAFVTQGMDPRQSGQRERNDTQTVGMLLDLVRTLAPKFQKNLMP